MGRVAARSSERMKIIYMPRVDYPPHSRHRPPANRFAEGAAYLRFAGGHTCYGDTVCEIGYQGQKAQVIDFAVQRTESCGAD